MVPTVLELSDRDKNKLFTVLTKISGTFGFYDDQVRGENVFT